MYNNKSILTIPTCITLLRLVSSPLVLPFLFVYLLPINSIIINACLALLFLLLSLTDFFDGYLARLRDEESELGRMLDPIADKFLIYATLVSLLAVHKIHFYVAIILIGRDFFVMGLRLIAVEHRLSLPVLYAAKVKTALLMISLAFIIFNPYQSYGYTQAPWWNGLQLFLVLLTTFLAIRSAYSYYQKLAVQVRHLYAQEVWVDDISER